MRRIALAEIGSRGNFAASGRYAPAVQPPSRDPVAEAYQAGFAEGQRCARSEAEAQIAQAACAHQAIELAFARFDECSANLLGERLRTSVAAIFEAMMGEIAIDPDRLAARVEIAADMLRRGHDARIVSMHPADVALVKDRLPGNLRVEPDAGLARGQIRVEDADGGVEDGPQQWLATLAQALGTCSR